MRSPHYESDDKAFPEDAYQVARHDGMAWSILGWETEPDQDTEYSGYEYRTGRVVAVMIGDDREFVFEAEDVTPLEPTAFCRSCGQIGCTHNAYESGR